MDDPGKTGTGATSASPAKSVVEADEFADIPRPRTRHPLLALGAAVLALFLVVKMRSDLTYFLSSREPADLGDARALVASERGRGVLAEGTNRLVRLHGTPDRESALQVDTKGSWTFTQFFKILGTDSRIFVHRREDPLPAFRAEHDVFEGRLLRFSELSFEDAISAYFAGHVSTTHFFAPDHLRQAVATGTEHSINLRDLTGDAVTLGPNDILAIDLRHPGEVEVALPIARFPDPESARAAVVACGAGITRAGRARSGYQSFIVTLTPAERDRVLDAIGSVDSSAEIHDLRETVKVRLADLMTASGSLTIRDGVVGQAGSLPPVPSTTRRLENVETIRTLAPVQIPPDAYLIVEAERPRDHLPEVAIVLILLVFATVNLIGLAKGLRR
jgi:hypothetical protein